MKRLLAPAAVAMLLAAACSTTQQPSDGIIRTDVPERPEGQTDMIGFAADPIDTVRVGFIGLGMRGPGAVNRFAHIPGTKVVALCDLDTTGINKSQRYLTRAGRPEADVYTGSDTAWRDLVRRDDLDLVYIVTDWKNHLAAAGHLAHGEQGPGGRHPGPVQLSDPDALGIPK